MIFDYRPLITLDPEEAQLNEGGANEWDNCGAADYTQILKWLGNGDPFEPQQIMDMIHGVGYHGGEVSRNLINFFNAHRDKYPNLPPITVEQGGDIVARVRDAATHLYPTTNWWWCNSNGDIQPRNTGILHWSGVIFDDGGNLGVWNIMRGQVVTMPYVFARAAYAGEFTTFKGSLEVIDTQELRLVVAGLAYALATGRTPNDAAHWHAMADSLRDDFKPNASGASASAWLLGTLGGYGKQLPALGGGSVAGKTVKGVFTGTIG